MTRVSEASAPAMTLTVLGCSGSVPGPDSPASGYLIEADGYRLVLDLGHGVFGALQRHVRPADIDAVIVSHLHADHCVDLTALVVALRYGGDGFRADAARDDGGRIPIIGVPQTRDRIEAAYDPFARKLSLHEIFSFAAATSGNLGPLQVSFQPVCHPIPTNAVKLEYGGRSLVFSGDTGPCPELIDFAAGADLFLCEASDAPGVPQVPDLHMTGRQAGEHAAAAGVGRLVVTHVPPWVSTETQTAEAGAVFDGPLDLATAGATYRI